MLPDQRHLFEQENDIITNVSKFQHHSMFFVKRGTAKHLDRDFREAPPMPQVTYWMRLLEPTLTRLVISDFLIMKTPTASEI